MSHPARCLEKALKLHLHVELSAFTFMVMEIPTEQGPRHVPRKTRILLRKVPLLPQNKGRMSARSF